MIFKISNNKIIIIIDCYLALLRIYVFLRRLRNQFLQKVAVKNFLQTIKSQGKTSRKLANQKKYSPPQTLESAATLSGLSKYIHRIRQ